MFTDTNVKIVDWSFWASDERNDTILVFSFFTGIDSGEGDGTWADSVHLN